MRILIDRCLERYAVTHATSMVPQSVKWGPHLFELPVAQRRYDSPREDEVFVREEVPYLVSLCRSAKDGKLEFCTSSELQMEAFRQSISKQGYRLVLGCEVDKGALPCGSVRHVEQSNRSCC